MIRINPRASAGACKAYYTGKQRADYYTDDSEIIGDWGGKGAKRLGLSGVVGKEEFERLCDNLDPFTGEQLTPRMKKDRLTGYDFTFDVPKSVSVLYGLTQDPRILEAFRQAVHETMEDFETQFETRVRKDGKSDDLRTTGEMAWAEFIHLTTRPIDGVPDPQMHGHMLVFNVTWDPVEQRYKAGYFANLKADAPDYQAAFHLRMAARLQDMGFDIERKGKAFEIVGVPESIIRHFSRRTERIEEEAKRRGITDPNEKAKLGAMTREAKGDELTPGQLSRIWRGGLQPDQLEAVMAVVEQVSPEMARVRAERPALLLAWTPEQGLTPKQQEAVDLAIEHCFTHESAVMERKFRAAIERFGVGVVRPQHLEGILQLIPELVTNKVGNKIMVTTKQVIAEERQMVDWVKAGKGAWEPLAPGHVIQDKKLGDDQRAAIRHILESRDRVTGVEGRAGTGKTTLMKEAVDAIEARDQRVVILAPTADARDVLRRAGFREAETVERWLVDENWRSHVGKQEIILVDEAGLLCTRDMVRLAELCEQRGSRIILSGDTRQHRAVMRGDVMRTLKTHADVALAEVTIVRRQKGIYKDAVEAIAEGYLDKGFEKLEAMGAIIEQTADIRYKSIAEQYLKARHEEKKVVIVSPTHSEIGKVNAAIREMRMARGELRDGTPMEVWREVHMDQAEKKDLRSYWPGLVLQMKKAAPGLKPGDKLTVTALADDLLKVERSDGRPLNFDPAAVADRFEVYRPEVIDVAVGDEIRITRNGRGRNGEALTNGTRHIVDGFTLGGEVRLKDGAVIPQNFRHWGYGYASTSYGAQGITAHKVIVAESSESFPAGSREQWYVSISRGMEEVQVYTDARDDLMEAVQRSSQRVGALDLEQGLSPEPPIPATPKSPAPAKESLGQKDLFSPSEPIEEKKPAPPAREALGGRKQVPQPAKRPTPPPKRADIFMRELLARAAEMKKAQEREREQVPGTRSGMALPQQHLKPARQAPAPPELTVTAEPEPPPIEPPISERPPVVPEREDLVPEMEMDDDLDP